MTRAEICIPIALRHEGGWVNNSNDPGGATNLGVTIGTLKRLGIDVDGDGDSDIADLKALRASDAVKVYKTFYWDVAGCDNLPVGIDFLAFDFALNSGPSRAIKELQKLLGVTVDGANGPKTSAAAEAKQGVALVNAYCDARLAFMRSLKHKTTGKPLWDTFGRGWTARVEENRRIALDVTATLENMRTVQPMPPVSQMPPASQPAAPTAGTPQPQVAPAAPTQPKPAPTAPQPGFWAWLLAFIVKFIRSL